MLTGNCLSFVGQMNTNLGPASVIGVGPVVVLSGFVAGAGLMVQDATTNEDCAEVLSSGADRFNLMMAEMALA